MPEDKNSDPTDTASTSKGAIVAACSPGMTGKARRHLRALGHHLKPVVQVGDKGVHSAVLAQIDSALDDHELIKIKCRGADLDARGAAALKIYGATGGQTVQILGRVLLVYRPNDEDPQIKLPR